MVIEWLKFRVSPELRETYIQKDAEIWTPAVANYPGFLGKEVWINPDKADEVIIVIRWQTREQWKSFPIDILEKVEAEFDAQMGKENYEMLESQEFQVRKFS